MSRFETPQTALLRAKLLASRETQRQRGWAAKVSQMRQRTRAAPQEQMLDTPFGPRAPSAIRESIAKTRRGPLRAATEPGFGRLGLLGKVPVAGPTLQRTGEFATSPVGLASAAIMPGLTAAGLAGQAIGGTIGGGLEAAGVGDLQTPLGGISPRTIGEFGGGFATPGILSAPGRAITRTGATRMGESLAESGGARALPGRLAREEVGGTKLPRLRPEAETEALPTPVNRLAAAIRNAGKVTAEQKAMFARQRGERTAAAADTLASGIERGEGRAAFGAAKGELKGELERPQFDASGFTDADMHEIVQGIGEADAPFYTKLHAQEALDEIGRGRIPQPAQLQELYRIHPELAQAVQSKRSLGTKAFSEFVSLLGLPQKLKSTFDFGTRMRQGLVLGWSHPRQWLSNWKPTTNAMFSEQAARDVLSKVEKNPWYSIEAGESAGLGFKDVGGHIYHWDPTTPGIERVEGFQGMNDSWINRATDKFPGILGSQRSFATDLNKSGMDVYAQHAGAMFKAGVRDPDQYKALAKVINHARGYGDFNPGEIAKGVHAFFSGRNLVSRFQVLSDPLFQPGSLFKPSARQLAARNLVGMVMGDMAVLGLIGTGGAATGLASVEMNPLKPGADWLKVRVGNTRVDPWGGFQPLARLIARMGAAAATETGVKDTGWSGGDVKGELVRFFTNKEAPLVRLLTDAIGWTYPFEKRELKPKLLAELYAPFITEDVWEAVKEHGALGAIVTPFSASGIGVQTYSDKEPEPESTPKPKARKRTPQINPALPRIQPREPAGTIGISR